MQISLLYREISCNTENSNHTSLPFSEELIIQKSHDTFDYAFLKERFLIAALSIYSRGWSKYSPKYRPTLKSKPNTISWTTLLHSLLKDHIYIPVYILFLCKYAILARFQALASFLSLAVHTSGKSSGQHEKKLRCCTVQTCLLLYFRERKHKKQLCFEIAQHIHTRLVLKICRSVLIL